MLRKRVSPAQSNVSNHERVSRTTFELYTPTIATLLPRKIASRLRTLLKNEAKMTYVRLNSQTPCPPRGAVPVNQGCCGRLFHSQHPDRFRSWLRPPQLCQLSTGMVNEKAVADKRQLNSQASTRVGQTGKHK